MDQGGAGGQWLRNPPGEARWCGLYRFGGGSTDLARLLAAALEMADGRELPGGDSVLLHAERERRHTGDTVACGKSPAVVQSCGCLGRRRIGRHGVHPLLAAAVVGLGNKNLFFIFLYDMWAIHSS